jgi:hypothetical protein
MKAGADRCEGRKPYGERDGETAVIERMRQLRLAGMSYRAIAGRLNSDGIPTRTVAGLYCELDPKWSYPQSVCLWCPWGPPVRLALEPCVQPSPRLVGADAPRRLVHA